jgi:hypothetical protein
LWYPFEFCASFKVVSHEVANQFALCVSTVLALSNTNAFSTRLATVTMAHAVVLPPPPRVVSRLPCPVAPLLALSSPVS